MATSLKPFWNVEPSPVSDVDWSLTVLVVAVFAAVAGPAASTGSASAASTKPQARVSDRRILTVPPLLSFIEAGSYGDPVAKPWRRRGAQVNNGETVGRVVVACVFAR